MYGETIHAFSITPCFVDLERIALPKSLPVKVTDLPDHVRRARGMRVRLKRVCGDSWSVVRGRYLNHKSQSKDSFQVQCERKQFCADQVDTDGTENVYNKSETSRGIEWEVYSSMLISVAASERKRGIEQARCSNDGICNVKNQIAVSGTEPNLANMQIVGGIKDTADSCYHVNHDVGDCDINQSNINNIRNSKTPETPPENEPTNHYSDRDVSDSDSDTILFCDSPMLSSSPPMDPFEEKACTTKHLCADKVGTDGNKNVYNKSETRRSIEWEVYSRMLISVAASERKREIDQVRCSYDGRSNVKNQIAVSSTEPNLANIQIVGGIKDTADSAPGLQSFVKEINDTIKNRTKLQSTLCDEEDSDLTDLRRKKKELQNLTLDIVLGNQKSKVESFVKNKPKSKAENVVKNAQRVRQSKCKVPNDSTKTTEPSQGIVTNMGNEDALTPTNTNYVHIPTDLINREYSSQVVSLEKKDTFVEKTTNNVINQTDVVRKAQSDQVSTIQEEMRTQCNDTQLSFKLKRKTKMALKRLLQRQQSRVKRVHHETHPLFVSRDENHGDCGIKSTDPSTIAEDLTIIGSNGQLHAETQYLNGIHMTSMHEERKPALREQASLYVSEIKNNPEQLSNIDHKNMHTYMSHSMREMNRTNGESHKQADTKNTHPEQPPIKRKRTLVKRSLPKVKKHTVVKYKPNQPTNQDGHGTSNSGENDKDTQNGGEPRQQDMLVLNVPNMIRNLRPVNLSDRGRRSVNDATEADTKTDDVIGNYSRASSRSPPRPCALVPNVAVLVAHSQLSTKDEPVDLSMSRSCNSKIANQPSTESLVKRGRSREVLQRDLAENHSVMRSLLKLSPSHSGVSLSSLKHIVIKPEQIVIKKENDSEWKSSSTNDFSNVVVKAEPPDDYA